MIPMPIIGCFTLLLLLLLLLLRLLLLLQAYPSACRY